MKRNIADNTNNAWIGSNLDAVLVYRLVSLYAACLRNCSCNLCIQILTSLVVSRACSSVSCELDRAGSFGANL